MKRVKGVDADVEVIGKNKVDSIPLEGIIASTNGDGPSGSGDVYNATTGIQDTCTLVGVECQHNSKGKPLYAVVIRSAKKLEHMYV